MSAQAMHGGRIAEAAAEFGLPQNAFVDFSANINVFAPAVSDADWLSWRVEIERYPEADAAGLQRQIAHVYGVDEEKILPTAGGIEALYLAARLFEGRKVAIIEPAFSDYARAFDAPRCVVLPREIWHAPIHEWAAPIADADVVVLGNPNNPTGAFQRRCELEQVIRVHPGKHWIVDEAFIEFTGDEQSLLPVLADHPSLIVLRSLTKSWGIPGLRLGFLGTANQPGLDRLRAMQPPWSVNAVAAAWARKFLTRERRVQLNAGLVQLGMLRESFAKRLSEIDGIHVHPPSANFSLLELAPSAPDASSIYRRLAHRGILVRVCDSFRGMACGRFLRVAVRTESENERLIAALAEVCAQPMEEAA